MEQQNDLQKRLLLALTLSFLVFIAFDVFLPKPVSDVESNKTITSQASQQSSTPTIEKHELASAPVLQPSVSSTPLSSVTPLATVNSKKIIYTIDELGRIAQVTMLEKKYEYEGKKLKLLNPEWIKPLEIRFQDKELTKEALSTPYTASTSEINVNTDKSTLILTQKLSSLVVTKTLTFYPDGHYDIHVQLSEDKPYFIMPGQRPNADHTMYMVVQGSRVKLASSEIVEFEDGSVDESDIKKHGVLHNVKFVSAFDRYFTSTLYDFKNPLTVYAQVTPEENALIFVQGSQDFKLQGYLGPKEFKLLKSIHPELTDVIEYGLITMISKPLFKLLNWFHSLVGNWGWAIVLVTLIIKLILFPLSYKGMMSMQRLKDLAPQMKELKEKYGKDPQKMNAKMMEMYKKHGANPMGGCLPMILQIPIFFAIYRVLLNSVELQGADWMLWITDLSQKDPFFVLPVLMGISMWYQQKLTPNTMTDPVQQKIFQYLPVVMTIFFVTFPAGLVLYWLVTNLFTIAQQYVINNAYAKQKASK